MNMALSKEWPQGWDEVRQLEFAQSVQPFGIVQREHVILTANDLERNKATVDDLKEYFTVSRALGDRLVKLEAQRTRFFAPVTFLLNVLRRRQRNRMPMLLLKLTALIILALPLMIAYSPCRIYFYLRSVKIRANHHQYFSSWLADKRRGIPTAL